MKEFLTVKETLEYLDITRATLYKLVNNGTLTIHKIGGGTRSYFRRDEILEAFSPGMSQGPKQTGQLIALLPA